MGISLYVVSSHTTVTQEPWDESWLTPLTKLQLRAFGLGWILYFLLTSFDYQRLREYCWIFYALTLLSLIGLFFTDSIARVHRWYRVPLIGLNFQPSEFAKFSVVLTLAWFLEKRRNTADSWGTAGYCGLIVGIPFILILKQPDLGSALVLYPISLVMFYFGGVNKLLVRLLSIAGAVVLTIVLTIFLGIVPFEEAKPYALHFLKEYQLERLNPKTHHQEAAKTAISMGGGVGSGWRGGDYVAEGWLPASYTDSVFPSWGEEKGFLGLCALMGLYYALLYFGFQVTALSKDYFGRLLSAGITVYLAMHVVVNSGMMVGLLPITGVPLPLISYGGSSILATMGALGLLQSIYSRRFMF